MSLRRVLPLAFLLPLGCSGGSAPGTGASAGGDTLAAVRAPAGPAAAVDTTWPVRRVPRWGFSFRWPDAHGLNIVGPRSVSCAAPAAPEDSLYREDGRGWAWWADTTLKPSITLHFVREAALDSLLKDEFFQRSASSPSGWVGVGRLGMQAPARFSRGGRWWELFATVPVGVENPGGGMALDEMPRGVAVVSRPDRCRMVLAWGEDLLEPPMPGELWRLLESIRFTGEDERHELRALQAFPGFDWHRRVGLVYPTLSGEACLIVASAGVPEGAPVLALAHGVHPAWLTLSPPGDQCGSVPRQPGDSLHLYDLARVDPSEGAGLEGIGVLAPAHPLQPDDPRTGDLDGDGQPDSFGFCSARGLYWGYVRSGSPTGPVVWKLGIQWPERTAGRCPADVVR